MTYLAAGFQLKDSKSGFKDESNAMIITQTKFQIESVVETKDFTLKEDGVGYTNGAFKFPG